MQALIDVILPVFFVIGAGYVFTWRGFTSEEGVEILMKFAQGIAIPALLFRAISVMDIQTYFQWSILVTFYFGSLCGFVLGGLGARFVFRRNAEDSVAIGFCCLFANSVLLGLPITERAYGADALNTNFVIVAFHAAFCYTIGILVMEVVRAKGQSAAGVALRVAKATFSTPLMIAMILGFAVNLSGLSLPNAAADAIDILARAGLPVALFALGGVLFTYKPEGDMRIIGMICVISLIIHPAIIWGLAPLMNLDTPALRSALLTAAMAPGANAYIFANMYGVAKRVAASAVLVATALSVFSVWVWLQILP